MPKEYTREQLWKLYKELPQELQDALFAEETGDNIYDICKRNEILGNLEEVVELVGQTLLGLLPPEDFQEALKKELKLKNDIAKKVAHEINRFIFFPVKESLASLYKIEVAPEREPSLEEPVKVTPPEAVAPSEEAIAPEEESEEREPEKEDIYREPID